MTPVEGAGGFQMTHWWMSSKKAETMSVTDGSTPWLNQDREIFLARRNDDTPYQSSMRVNEPPARSTIGLPVA